MKYVMILLSIFYFSLFSPGFTSSAFAIDDAIIAVVDEELITLKDLKDYVHSVLTQLKMEKKYSPDELKAMMSRIEENALDRLIDDRIVLNAANALGYEAKQDVVDEKMKEFRDRYSSEQDFIDALAAEGLTLSDLRKKIADQLKAQHFVDNIIKSKIQVNPQDVTDFYNANPEKFKSPATVDLDSIFIPFKDDQDEAHQQAQEAQKLLMEGHAFKEVAEEFSAAPSIGRIMRGQVKPEIEKEVFNQPVGYLTQPIKTEEGYFILKIAKKIPVQQLSLENAKGQIAQFLFNQKFKEEMKSWLDEQKENTFIEIKNP